MALKEKIARMFRRGKKEKRSTFVVFFKHSQRSVEFESTWEEIKSLSKRFGGEKGLKMNNFFVPWGEVASIYEKGPEEGKETPKPGDTPGTREVREMSDLLSPMARELGAKFVEVIRDPKDAPIDGVKAAVEEEKKIKAEKI